jgi:hypothetical protein
MAWASESQMVQAFSERMTSEKSELHKEFLILQESKTNYGRPDVMIVEYDTSAITARSSQSFSMHEAPFTSECAYAMAFLSEAKRANMDSLQRFLQCGNAKLHSIVNCLTIRNLINVYKEAIRPRKREEIFYLNRILVFEAKLEKWRAAIAQAERHLWFTGASYIILPDKKPKILVKVREECLQKGIGLISFSKDSVIDYIVRPSDMRIYNTHFTWLLNEKVLQKTTYGARRIQSVYS